MYSRPKTVAESKFWNMSLWLDSIKDRNVLSVEAIKEIFRMENVKYKQSGWSELQSRETSHIPRPGLIIDSIKQSSIEMRWSRVAVYNSDTSSSSTHRNSETL